MSEFFIFANNHPFWAVVLAVIALAPFRYLAIGIIAACGLLSKRPNAATEAIKHEENL